MGIKLHREPKMERPALVASWSGIGNIGLIAVETLRSQLWAEELGEIEPWDFFYPKGVVIRDGVLEDLVFPINRFFYKKAGGKGLILFLGEEQPSDGGRKGYQLANYVLDVAEKFGCQRVYTAGAAVALSHHTLKPRVWAAASQEHLLREVRSQENTVLMSELEGRGGGSITGLNGILFGLARKRGFEAICLMGEVPDYLTGAPFPYPRGSKSLLEVLSSLLDIAVGYGSVDTMIARVDDFIEGIYDKFPAELKERIEQRKKLIQPRAEAISEEEQQWLKEHIDELFRKGGTGG